MEPIEITSSPARSLPKLQIDITSSPAHKSPDIKNEYFTKQEPHVKQEPYVKQEPTVKREQDNGSSIISLARVLPFLAPFARHFLCREILNGAEWYMLLLKDTEDISDKDLAEKVPSSLGLAAGSPEPKQEHGRIDMAPFKTLTKHFEATLDFRNHLAREVQKPEPNKFSAVMRIIALVDNRQMQLDALQTLDPTVALKEESISHTPSLDGSAVRPAAKISFSQLTTRSSFATPSLKTPVSQATADTPKSLPRADTQSLQSDRDSSTAHNTRKRKRVTAEKRSPSYSAVPSTAAKKVKRYDKKNPTYKPMARQFVSRASSVVSGTAPSASTPGPSSKKRKTAMSEESLAQPNAETGYQDKDVRASIEDNDYHERPHGPSCCGFKYDGGDLTGYKNDDSERGEYVCIFHGCPNKKPFKNLQGFMVHVRKYHVFEDLRWHQRSNEVQFIREFAFASILENHFQRSVTKKEFMILMKVLSKYEGDIRACFAWLRLHPHLSQSQHAIAADRARGLCILTDELWDSDEFHKRVWEQLQPELQTYAPGLEYWGPSKTTPQKLQFKEWEKTRCWIASGCEGSSANLSYTTKGSYPFEYHGGGIHPTCIWDGWRISLARSMWLLWLTGGMTKQEFVDLITGKKICLHQCHKKDCFTLGHARPGRPIFNMTGNYCNIHDHGDADFCPIPDHFHCRLYAIDDSTDSVLGIPKKRTDNTSDGYRKCCHTGCGKQFYDRGELRKHWLLDHGVPSKPSFGIGRAPILASGGSPIAFRPHGMSDEDFYPDPDSIPGPDSIPELSSDEEQGDSQEPSDVDDAVRSSPKKCSPFPGDTQVISDDDEEAFNEEIRYDKYNDPMSPSLPRRDRRRRYRVSEPDEASISREMRGFIVPNDVLDSDVVIQSDDV